MVALAATVYLAIPCYNEEAVLPETAKRLREKFRALRAAGVITPGSRICFADDGSKDATWTIIERLHDAEPETFSGIRLSRNRGHQNALLCALMTLRDRADCVISMDADLQDDIDAIDQMVDKCLEGCDIVYGVRSQRKTDTAFKRATAEGFYKVIDKMGGEVVFNHADYRLMSRRALAALAEYKEVNLFLRGIVPMLGYKTDVVYYERAERFAGESKYPLKKMLALAFDGITSLSTKPMKLITLVGAGCLLLAFVLLIVGIVAAATGGTMLDWKIICLCILLVGGLILIALGVVGGYVGKIYMETKQRPRYFVSQVLHDK